MIRHTVPARRPLWRRLAARRKLWAVIALCLPFFFLLWPPFYNLDQPEIWGIPFFYWSQLAWIAITSAITATLYWLHIEF